MLRLGDPFSNSLQSQLDVSSQNHYIDYAIHASIFTPQQINEMNLCVEKGITSFKIYMNLGGEVGHLLRDIEVELQGAVRKLAALPAHNLRVDRRGELKVGYYADVVVFDPDKVQDHATFTEPHQYATGMVHVFVNGEQVLKDGEHTGATPGRVVRGPGWTGVKQ